MPVAKRKGSPFYWYSFSLGGSRFRGSTRKETKREAEEVERDHYQLAKQNQLSRSDWTLLMVLNAYWHEGAKDRRGHRTIETNLAVLQKLLGKDTRTSKLTNGALMDYRAKRRGQNVQHHTVNREFCYLRAAYRHCHKFHDQPMPNIQWQALMAAEPPGRIRFLSREEYARLMEVAHESIRPIILCAVTTGLRKENILSLQWRQVNLDGRLIQVTVKGNKHHGVRIGKALMAALSARPGTTGRVFDTTNFRKRWDAAVVAAKLGDFRFHDLRHTFASWARQSGADIADIKEALGHTTVNMTMRYAHIKSDEAVTAFDRVSDSVLAQSRAQSRKKRRK